MSVENEIHIFFPGRGHTDSFDCWCEPTRIVLTEVRSFPGLTLVIEHDEPAEEHHLVVLNRREASPDWVTLALNHEPPRLLPPHDPNERTI